MQTLHKLGPKKGEKMFSLETLYRTNSLIFQIMRDKILIVVISFEDY